MHVFLVYIYIYTIHLLKKLPLGPVSRKGKVHADGTPGAWK